ncbi:MAG: nitroreductase family protein [Bacteroidales bacterium]
MELKQAIEKRTSVRVYKKDPVPLSDLKEMVRLASLAPSVANFQPWKFVIITNKELLESMARKVALHLDKIPANESRAAQNVKSQVEWFATFFQDAPALVAVAMETYESVLEKGVTMDHDEINRQRNHPDIQSAGACIQNMLLAAVDMDYGACWLSAPMMVKETLEEMLGLEDKYKLMAFVAVGKPEKVPVKKASKDPEEMIKVIE